MERRIQRYIRAKEKLIALLEEQKQVITHKPSLVRSTFGTRNPTETTRTPE